MSSELSLPGFPLRMAPWTSTGKLPGDVGGLRIKEGLVEVRVVSWEPRDSGSNPCLSSHW